MTKCGERVSAEHEECSGSPAESIFGGVKSRRFIAGAAEMNVWRRKVARGYNTLARGGGGIISPQGVKNLSMTFL